MQPRCTGTWPVRGPYRAVSGDPEPVAAAAAVVETKTLTLKRFHQNGFGSVAVEDGEGVAAWAKLICAT